MKFDIHLNVYDDIYEKNLCSKIRNTYSTLVNYSQVSSWWFYIIYIKTKVSNFKRMSQSVMCKLKDSDKFRYKGVAEGKDDGN